MKSGEAKGRWDKGCEAPSEPIGGLHYEDRCSRAIAFLIKLFYYGSKVVAC